jgi:hypothetical protein
MINTSSLRLNGDFLVDRHGVYGVNFKGGEHGAGDIFPGFHSIDAVYKIIIINQYKQ